MCLVIFPDQSKVIVLIFEAKLQNLAFFGQFFPLFDRFQLLVT